MHAHGDDLFTVARVCFKIKAESIDEFGVYLQSTISSGQPRIRLDLRSVASCSLFPGQIIGIEGSNLDGKKLVAKRLFDDARPSRPYSWTSPAHTTELRVLIAAGPYAADAFQSPFHSSALPTILKLAESRSVHAVILLGPFVDTKCWDSDTCAVPTSELPFDRLFEQNLMQPLLAELSNLSNRPELLLVPSLHDAHHHFVFPQPPYVASAKGKDRSSSNTCENLHLVANPSIVRLSGLTIGLTSYDVLHDLFCNSFTKGTEQNIYPQPAELAAHLVKQGSFYPLYPPAPAFPLDSTQLRHIEFPFVPDVLVVPSRLPIFAQITAGTAAACINPGFAVDGTTYGTVALLTLHPISPDATCTTADRVEVEVVRL